MDPYSSYQPKPQFGMPPAHQQFGTPGGVPGPPAHGYFPLPHPYPHLCTAPDTRNPVYTHAPQHPSQYLPLSTPQYPCLSTPEYPCMYTRSFPGMCPPQPPGMCPPQSPWMCPHELTSANPQHVPGGSVDFHGLAHNFQKKFVGLIHGRPHAPAPA